MGTLPSKVNPYHVQQAEGAARDAASASAPAVNVGGVRVAAEVRVAAQPQNAGAGATAQPTGVAPPFPADGAAAPAAQPAAGAVPAVAEKQAAAAGATPAAPSPPAPKPADTGEGLWVIDDPVRRARMLETFYDVPEATRDLGRGHYGVVRKGIRKVDGARVAIKTIPKRRAIYVEMLKNEVAILKAIDHVNVVKLYDEFEDARQVHLVFELCTGGELFEPIADQNFRFTERQASRLVRKMLLAVKYCHDRNIAHRDLKPENMLLTFPGVDAELKVIDFGLATVIKPGEILTRHVGTPYYIAPEVLERRYGKSCDLWSVGVIMFTLLCGFPPFWGDTERDIYNRVRRGYFTFDGPDWAMRSHHSKDLIKSLLIMIPKKRMTVDDALAHPWIVHEGEVIDPHSKRIVYKLRRYTLFPWLKRLALAVVAKSLTPAQEAYARDVFESFDVNERKVITAVELKSSLRRRGFDCSDDEIDALLDGLDLNRDSMITFTEFAAAVMPRLFYLNDKQAYDVFNILDVDHDGEITFNDLHNLINDKHFAAHTLMECDTDGDGKLTFSDFLAVMAGNEGHIL